MRAGVLSDVPPNFWTRIGRDERLKRSPGTKAPLAWGDAPGSGTADNIALPRQPFRQENCAFAGTELGVVREHDVLHAVERRLVTHAADCDRHAVARIAVAAWLRTERVGGDLQQTIGCRRQTFESIGAEPL